MWVTFTKTFAGPDIVLDIQLVRDLQPHAVIRAAFLSCAPLFFLVFLTYHTSLWYIDPLILKCDSGQSFIFLRLLVWNKDINSASPGTERSD